MFYILFCGSNTIKYFINTNKMVTAAKLIGAGLATIGLAGAGVGIGNVFGSLLIASWLSSWK